MGVVVVAVVQEHLHAGAHKVVVGKGVRNLTEVRGGEVLQCTRVAQLPANYIGLERTSNISDESPIKGQLLLRFVLSLSSHCFLIQD